MKSNITLNPGRAWKEWRGGVNNKKALAGLEESDDEKDRTAFQEANTAIRGGRRSIALQVLLLLGILNGAVIGGRYLAHSMNETSTETLPEGATPENDSIEIKSDHGILVVSGPLAHKEITDITRQVGPLMKYAGLGLTEVNERFNFTRQFPEEKYFWLTEEPSWRITIKDWLDDPIGRKITGNFPQILFNHYQVRSRLHAPSAIESKKMDRRLEVGNFWVDSLEHPDISAKEQDTNHLWYQQFGIPYYDATENVLYIPDFYTAKKEYENNPSIRLDAIQRRTEGWVALHDAYVLNKDDGETNTKAEMIQAFFPSNTFYVPLKKFLKEQEPQSVPDLAKVLWITATNRMALELTGIKDMGANKPDKDKFGLFIVRWMYRFACAMQFSDDPVIKKYKHLVREVLKNPVLMSPK